MTRLFLAAGVAAMAIAAPLAAKPGGGHGNGGGAPPQAHQGGGGGGHGGGGQPAARQGGGGGGHGHGGGQAAVMGGGGGHGHGGGGAPRMMGVGGGGHGHGGGFAAPQMQHAQPQQAHGNGHQQARNVQRQQSHGNGHQQARNVMRQQAHGNGHQQARNVVRQQGRGNAHQQARNVMRQQVRGNGHQQAGNAQKQQLRGVERQQARNFNKQQMRANNMQQSEQQAFANQLNGQQSGRFNGGGGFNGKGAKFANGQMAQNFAAPYRTFSYGNDVQIVPVTQVERFVGVPVAQVPNFYGLSPLPASLQYFYPSTSNYYYQYGDGYLYQVDRGSSLISALIPLLFGGYMPGQYLPATYMSSYVPSYYGFNNFYPDYGDVCNRYYYGVIYQVDCNDGYVENVLPMYAGGYGVGQLLPSSYDYYNVPLQYRSMYYDTPDYGYWYSPGAIYQYDQRSSVITSVATLLSPGFSIGQPLPAGYGVYNVPYDYRTTYYDTPDAWYRYNNGYIYQVDPVSQLVTAIVASLLT